MLRHVLATGLAVALLSGCAVAPGGGPAVPAAGPQFDGVYTGENTLVRGWGGACGPPAFQQSVSVQNGQFYYPFAPNPPVVSQIPVQIAADGSIAAQTQYGINEPTPLGLYKTYWLIIRGHITAAGLDFAADDQWCVRHLVLQRH